MFNASCISQEWASRPDSERFCSLPELAAHAHGMRDHSKHATVALSRLKVQAQDSRVVLVGDTKRAALSHLAFGQLCADVKAPAGYLRTLTPTAAATCLQEGLQAQGADVMGKLLLTEVGDAYAVRAVTGPDYGRIWNADVADALMERFGDGVTGTWRVPGEFGKALDAVTKDNTTLYLGDSTMFVALANETDRIEIPDRRDGKRGSLAQGIIVANSETGTGRAWMAYFLFDFICCNRMIWGLEEFQEVSVRHTKHGPGRWVEKTSGQMAQDGRLLLTKQRQLILDAQSHRLGDQADVVKFMLGQKVTRSDADSAWDAHLKDEGRPMETRWDVATGLTAYARGLTQQDDRVRLERRAGALLAAA